MNKDAEIIIAGAGLAGSTVLRHLLTHPVTKDLPIVVIDRDQTIRNDKTWCFWSFEDAFVRSHTYKKWNNIALKSNDHHSVYELKHHSYQCIKSADYLEASKTLANQDNVKWISAKVEDFFHDGESAVVKTDQGELRSTLVLQSCLKAEPIAGQLNSISLLQHFLGWEIELDIDTFDPETAVFMDFQTRQKHGFAFVYVLPFSKRSALVEYTLFTDQLIEESEYEGALEEYLITQLNIPSGSWKITRTEFGIIPMEDVRYTPWWDKGILNMGLNAGQPKASTGYTFSRIQRYSALVTSSIASRNMQDLNQQSKARFMFYDRLILWMLREKPEQVPGIFLRLFGRNSPDLILDFLDEQTHFGQELRIFYSTKWRFFIEAIIKSTKK
jgi:lycopene beta-cyclase